MEQIMNQTDVKVSFYLKKSEADARGNCPVMARLIVGKHSETAFSVKFRVPQSLWSSGRACGKSVAARDINNRLDEIRAAALGIYAEQSAIREDVTAEDVKHQLLGMASEQETLLSYFRLFIRNFEKRVGINRTEKTLRAYRNSYNHLVRFLQMQYKLSDIPFAALDRSFIEKYDLYLRTECCLASGTIVNLTVQLKTIVGEAIADGIITVFPFVGYEPVHPKPEQKYLTSEELNRIMTTPLHDQILYHVRDIFLFSCYTGIPYSDMCLLTNVNMHCHLIVSRKDQTNKKKLSPLTNHKNTKNGVIKGGFDRVNLFRQAEQGFDKLFSYNRQLSESFEYSNTMKNGSIDDKLRMQEQELKEPKYYFTGEKKKDVFQSSEKENNISCNLDNKADEKHSYSHQNNGSGDSLLSIISLGKGNNYDAASEEELQTQKRKKKKGIRR